MIAVSRIIEVNQDKNTSGGGNIEAAANSQNRGKPPQSPGKTQGVENLGDIGLSVAKHERTGTFTFFRLIVVRHWTLHLCLL